MELLQLLDLLFFEIFVLFPLLVFLLDRRFVSYLQKDRYVKFFCSLFFSYDFGFWCWFYFGGAWCVEVCIYICVTAVIGISKDLPDPGKLQRIWDT